ncbi:uncharacterized protein LOC117343268 [Pecten maximus]|uniref:uncharacterized protein LOC117343268 n=1 Tax=Pecten maximus TaxID=6579 RepID=UPI0014583900|nr:uncharacterized protein LOC117343268 [Pecten maximus]
MVSHGAKQNKANNDSTNDDSKSDLENTKSKVLTEVEGLGIDNGQAKPDTGKRETIRQGNMPGSRVCNKGGSNIVDRAHKEIQDTSTVQLKPRTLSCLYAKANIDGAYYSLLVDSGSSVSIISHKLFERLGLDEKSLRGTRLVLLAANGKKLGIKGEVKLDFTLNNKQFQHRFVIADIRGITGLLGTDFLEHYNGILHVAKKKLQTSKGQVTLVKLDDVRECACIRVKETIRIPPESELVIEARLEGETGSDLACILPGKFSTDHQLLVAHSLLEQGKAELPEHLKPLVERSSVGLDEEQADALTKLIAEFQDIFVDTSGKLGQTDLTAHRIDTERAKSIKIPPRRVPLAKKEVIEAELEKMLGAGVIEPSDSPWSAPICLVTKKDGSCRFCIDFRGINAVTRKDAYPLPRIDDTLDTLAGARWFCTLDMASGYWQIKMDEADKHKTAFSTHLGLFEFNVMPFGLANAAATFERLMEMVLKGLNWKKCLCYLDDVVVFGTDFKTTLQNLELVFQRFRQANLKLKPKKCELFRKEIVYLGHIVSEEGIRCDPTKTSAFKEWNRPHSATEVRSFLGLVGYYRKFIDSFAHIANPLMKLLKKNVKFHWDTKCEEAFNKLKGSLLTAPVLSFPTREDRFILDTDASATGIGAILVQLQNGEEKVICYAAKTLNGAQRNYCTTKRELLAVVTFVRHFKYYLTGRRFTIRTDHAPLVWLKNVKEPEGILARWISILETFDFEIMYRAGTQHRNADAMSRQASRKCKRDDCPDCYGEKKVSKPEVASEPEVRPTQEVVSKPEVSSTPEVRPTPEVVSKPEAASEPEVVHAPEVSSKQEITCKPEVIHKPEVRYEQEGESDQEVISKSINIHPIITPQQHNPLEGDTATNWLDVWTKTQLTSMQEQDISISKVIEILDSDSAKPNAKTISKWSNEVKTLYAMRDSLEIIDGLLYKRTDSELLHKQLIAPTRIRQHIFEELHIRRTAGHFGRDRSLAAIKKRFYWVGMSEDIARWCKQCDICAKGKPGPGSDKSALRQFHPTRPMQYMAVDIFGGLPVSNSGNAYIIVVGDYFTKLKEAFAVPNHTALTVADKLVTEVFCRFGCPEFIHTDQGAEFESELFQTVCRKLEVNKTRTSPYHPQSDGLVERFNRTMKRMLATFAHENKEDWDDHLPYLMLAYRSSVHSSTGYSPNKLMLGREVMLPIDLMVGLPPGDEGNPCPVAYVEWMQHAMNTAFDSANNNLGLSAKRQKKYYDIGTKDKDIEVGTWVWRWYPPAAGQKLELGWTGPHLVIARLSELTYTIQKDPRAKLVNIHIDQLKSYLGSKPPQNWVKDSVHESGGRQSGSLGLEDSAHESQGAMGGHQTVGLPVVGDNGQNMQGGVINRQIEERRTRGGRTVKPPQVYSP